MRWRHYGLSFPPVDEVLVQGRVTVRLKHSAPHSRTSSLIACNLFTRDYLLEGITRSQQWLTFADADVIRST
jgi:hypothetical protein